MNNNDLISRAAALNVLLMSKNYRDAHDSLEQLPAVDAVPVVRCAYCKHYEEEPYGDVMMCYRGLGYTRPSDYCSRGEWRESE